jgi:hypothetical protein
MRRFLIAASCVVMTFAFVSTPAHASKPSSDNVSSPSVTPASGGAGVPFMLGMFTNFAAIGYHVDEFFMSGNVHSYSSNAPLRTDGKWWTHASVTTAPYKTRVLVVTPNDPQKFNGTVYVEWLNVSGGLDASPDLTHGHLEMAREGAAYVGVSAQIAGINTLQGGGPLGPLVPGDPARYASLHHPGDSYSYDMFSQAGEAVTDGELLGGLTPQRLIAVGESQSASRLVTYIDAVHPLVDLYDGFLVHSRGRSGAALSQSPLPAIPVPVPTEIRKDSRTPVLVFQDETDVAGSLLQARQKETHNGNYRLWEVAGTSHFDLYGLTIGPSDIGNGQGEAQALELLQHPISAPIPGIIECALPVNDGPQHWVINSALHHLNDWVTDGAAPPIAPRLETTSAPGESPVVFAKDANGNTLGGIRTPFVDAAIATLLGTGNSTAPGGSPTSTFCSIFGLTIPFTDAQLASLYPSHDDFVRAYMVAVLSAVNEGYLLPPDGLALFNAAVATTIGGA